jgi:hypothetical protein
MLEFKSNRALKILAWVLVAILCFVFSYIIYPEKPIERKEPSHNLTLYNSEGDTILDLDTEASSVKIWIEENGEPDVWISNENGGWTRK